VERSLIERVVANVFHKFMTSGRTAPVLLGCSRVAHDDADYVVKTIGGCDLGSGQLTKELAAAQLADYFGIPHPRQAFVEIDEELANLIAQQEPSHAEAIRRSVGLGFGTEYLHNLITWPVDRQPSASQFQDACAIFAFDVLIQNPDRQFRRPNLGAVGDQIYVFDHELAFSSQYAIPRNLEPWRVANDQSWTSHVFYNQLHRRPVELTEFLDRLEKFPFDFFADLAKELPDSWDAQTMEFIEGHMRDMSAHSTEFSDELMRRLA
jgi:hypothetical protein